MVKTTIEQNGRSNAEFANLQIICFSVYSFLTKRSDFLLSSANIFEIGGNLQNLRKFGWVAKTRAFGVAYGCHLNAWCCHCSHNVIIRGPLAGCTLPRRSSSRSSEASPPWSKPLTPSSAPSAAPAGRPPPRPHPAPPPLPSCTPPPQTSPRPPRDPRQRLRCHPFHSPSRPTFTPCLSTTKLAQHPQPAPSP